MYGGTIESDQPDISTDVLIIGGGVAGLSAAVDLTLQGYSIVLVEQKKHLGGRTYSFPHPETGSEVDNGQHLMMGCYAATLRYIESIGSADDIRIQDRLSITFKHRTNRSSKLQAALLPAPLNIAAGLLRLTSLSLPERLSLLRVGLDLLMKDPDTDKQLRSITVAQWLERLKQSERNKQYLWDIIAVGALNDSPDKISAALFAKVLKTAFFGSRKNSSMVIPQRGLSVVLIEKAAALIARQGGRVFTDTTAIVRDNADLVSGKIRLENGRTIHTKAIISAVPYFDIPKVFGSGESIGVRNIDQFASSPIVTLHLWFDSHFMHEEFVALLDSPLHWVFNKSKMCGKENDALMYLSIVISGAEELVTQSKELLAGMAYSELRHYYPTAASSNIVHSLVIKEKRATFSPSVGSERFRPPHRTSVPNLFLAGDWTDTKLPATIEGAIQSGYACSALAQEYLKTKNPNR